jgi:MoaA/NifB/PqqE/SkfB family radical SAM enzyme
MIEKHPKIYLENLDNLWFQVSGTICNIACKHCFNNSSPTNRSFGFMSLKECETYIMEAVKMGLKEFYFTGGEPFANKEIIQILKYTLQFGPATVLSNGMLIKENTAQQLKEISLTSIYTLEFRISLDGYTENMNDNIRGRGIFQKAMKGLKVLYEADFLPIVTITKTWEDSEEDIVIKNFTKMLKESGYCKPRIKILPSIKIGQEALRTRGYDKYEYVYEEMLQDYDVSQLICSNSRLVTNKGVFACPILLNEQDARLGDTLKEAKKNYELKHQACYTCYLYGTICSNFSSVKRDV